MIRDDLKDELAEYFGPMQGTLLFVRDVLILVAINVAAVGGLALFVVSAMHGTYPGQF